MPVERHSARCTKSSPASASSIQISIGARDDGDRFEQAIPPGLSRLARASTASLDRRRDVSALSG